MGLTREQQARKVKLTARREMRGHNRLLAKLRTPLLVDSMEYEEQTQQKPRELRNKEGITRMSIKFNIVIDIDEGETPIVDGKQTLELFTTVTPETLVLGNATIRPKNFKPWIDGVGIISEMSIVHVDAMHPFTDEFYLIGSGRDKNEGIKCPLSGEIVFVIKQDRSEIARAHIDLKDLQQRLGHS